MGNLRSYCIICITTSDLMLSKNTQSPCALIVFPDVKVLYITIIIICQTILYTYIEAKYVVKRFEIYIGKHNITID